MCIPPPVRNGADGRTLSPRETQFQGTVQLNPLTSHLGQKKLNHIWGFCMNTDTFNWFFYTQQYKIRMRNKLSFKETGFLKSRLSFSDINFRHLFRFLPFCGTHQSNSSSSLTELISKNHQLQANFSLEINFPNFASFAPYPPPDKNIFHQTMLNWQYCVKI